MLRLTGDVEAEILSVTACRLIKWGTSEREACALANVIALERDTPDAVVEQRVIEALVGVKEAVDGVPDIEYVAGRRCDVQRRLEGR